MIGPVGGDDGRAGAGTADVSGSDREFVVAEVRIRRNHHFLRIEVSTTANSA
jgi:hypothetical protein